MTDDVLQMLQECNYLVCLSTYRKPLESEEKDDCTGYPYCTAQFPKRIMLPAIDQHYYIYSIQHDKQQVIIEKWGFNEEEPSTFKISAKAYKMPIYLMRIFILTHYMLICQKYEYNREYSLYLCDQLLEGAVDEEEMTRLPTIDAFFKAMFAPDTQQDIDQEEKIVEIFVKTYSRYFSNEYDSLAKQSGVLDGYEVLRSLLKEIQE